MARYKTTNGELERSFSSLFNAISSADISGQGYKVYDGGVLVYEQIRPKRRLMRKKSAVLAVAKEMATQMAAIKSWYYSNVGCAGTFKAAIDGRKYKSNCATLSNWIFRKLKITSSGEYFYGKAGSIIQWRNNATQDAVRSKCDVFKVGVTVKTALDLGMLQPGDICLYAKQHTNVYAGGNKWYESGTVYANGSGAEGTPLHKFYGTTILYDYVISWVIRYNDPAYKARAREYRVQCGMFGNKANAKNLQANLKKAGIKAILVSQCGDYIVQTGRFSLLGNAIQQYQDITEAGYDCMIKGI